MFGKVKLFIFKARSVLVTLQLAHTHTHTHIHRFIHDLWTLLQEMIS